MTDYDASDDRRPLMRAEFPQSCPYGHTLDDLRVILGTRLPEFRSWMAGQTMMLCDARLWDYDIHEFTPSRCAPDGHGPIVYASDLRRFLTGRGPVDW